MPWHLRIFARPAPAPLHSCPADKATLSSSLTGWTSEEHGADFLLSRGVQSQNRDFENITAIGAPNMTEHECSHPVPCPACHPSSFHNPSPASAWKSVDKQGSPARGMHACKLVTNQLHALVYASTAPVSGCTCSSWAPDLLVILANRMLFNCPPSPFGNNCVAGALANRALEPEAAY